MLKASVTSPIAVLTGDIVSSTSLSKEVRSRLPDVLRSVGDQVREHFEGAGPSPIDIFRGDGWQLVLRRPAAALRVALYFQSRLHSMSAAEEILSRTAIGIGQADFIPQDAVSEGDGEAFRLSGKALEEMDRHRQLAIRVEDVSSSCECQGLPTMLALVDALTKRWTAKQALAVSGALRELRQEEIGSTWDPAPITQQAIAQHLESAGWGAVNEAVAYFERVFRHLSYPEADGRPLNAASENA